MGVSGQRYYDPKTGRFLGRDPKEEKGGRHLYAFVGNNPTNKWDHLGMETMAAFGVNGGRRTTYRITDPDDGCDYEVTEQDMSDDPAYGERMEISIFSKVLAVL